MLYCQIAVENSVDDLQYFQSSYQKYKYPKIQNITVQ